MENALASIGAEDWSFCTNRNAAMSGKAGINLRNHIQDGPAHRVSVTRQTALPSGLSVARSGAMAARVGGAETFAGIRVDADCFDLAQPGVPCRDVIAAALEVPYDGRRHRWLENNILRHPLFMKAR